MFRSLHEIAWHRSFGVLIELIDQTGFWQALVRRVGSHLHFNNWVALLFEQGRPWLLAESPAADGGPDPLFQDYLAGLYRIDPFWQVNSEQPQSGLFQLADVAPDCFETTEYYQRYFRLNIVADEVQFNCLLPDNRLVLLSFGSQQKISEAEIGWLSLIKPWVLALLRQRMAYEKIETPAMTDNLQALRETLTARELEIVQLMLSGHSNKVMANRLNIALDTIKTHRRHIYSKLNIKTQAELLLIFLGAN